MKDTRMKYNLISKGDNLKIMQELVEQGYSSTIDLIYIDPPFATNNIFTFDKDRVSTISTSKNENIAYIDKFSLEEYLDFIKPRLKLMHTLLSQQGSLYFHIDCKIGHYVKILLDSIFGINQFKAEITRIKCNPKNFYRKNYGNIKDMLLFYTKTNDYIWNDIKIAVSDCDIVKRYSKIDKKGRYTTVPLHAPGETVNGDTSKKFMGQSPPKGRHWRYSPKTLQKLYEDNMIETSNTGNMRLKNYADKYADKKLQDIWEFKDPQYPNYPTAKNPEMLDFIILNSSNKDSIVMDCFCGGGTTLLSAYKFGRKYIGIDKSDEAIIQTTKALAKLDNVKTTESLF